MSYISYAKFGIVNNVSENYYSVSGKDRLQDKNIDQVNLSLRENPSQIKKRKQINRTN